MITKHAKEIFAENMRTRRRALHISQEKLGQMCGLHRTYIGGIEQFIRNPSLKSMDKIADALNTSVSLLTNEHYDEIINSDYAVCNFDEGDYIYHPVIAADLNSKELEILDNICNG